MAKEWRVTCDDCPMYDIKTRKPKFGAFHWTAEGKCSSIPRVEVREVGRWQPVEEVART